MLKRQAVISVFYNHKTWSRRKRNRRKNSNFYCWIILNFKPRKLSERKRTSLKLKVYTMLVHHSCKSHISIRTIFSIYRMQNTFIKSGKRSLLSTENYFIIFIWISYKKPIKNLVESYAIRLRSCDGANHRSWANIFYKQKKKMSNWNSMHEWWANADCRDR